MAMVATMLTIAMTDKTTGDSVGTDPLAARDDVYCAERP